MTELRDAHKGERAFILGNGYSVTYYDTTAMAKEGVLFGCNKAFHKHPIDYLVFQDQALTQVVDKFDGIVFCPFRSNRLKDMRPEHTFFINFPRHDKSEKGKEFGFDLMHSGGLALQIACFLGFKEIILVGCDCCFIFDGNRYRSNIFEDKHYKRIKGKKRTVEKQSVKHEGKVSVKSLERFAEKFRALYKRFSANHDIYQMGEWGILKIPSIDYEGFWSNKHPGRIKNSGFCNTA